MLTAIEEIEFVRSPFYDYAKAKVDGGEATEEMMEDFAMKTAMIDPLTQFMTAPLPTRENTAFFRYQDRSDAPDHEKHIF